MNPWPIILLNLVWIGLMLHQEAKHSKERADLYNRIMARDLDEYQEATAPPSTSRSSIPNIALKNAKMQRDARNHVMDKKR